MSEIPADKLTDHKYLLRQVRKSFRKSNVGNEAPVVPMSELLESMTVEKQQHRLAKKQERLCKIEKRLHLLKLERMAKGSEVKHEKGWNFSVSSDRVTRPPHHIEGMDLSRAEDDPKPCDSRNSHPWLPTTLVGRNFGTSPNDTLTKEYTVVLRREIERNMAECGKELEGLISTTEEGLYQKARCTQAMREYKVMLDDLLH